MYQVEPRSSRDLPFLVRDNATGFINRYCLNEEDARSQVERLNGIFYPLPVLPPNLPPIPEWFKFIVPNGIPLALFEEQAVEYHRRDAMADSISLTVEQAKPLLVELNKALTVQRMVAECTPHGSGKGIKTNKPTDGIMAYVWRMARFANGDDPSIPMTAYWDLADGLSKLQGQRVSTALINPGLKLIVDFLEKKADELVTASGGNKYAGALRWARAGLF